LLVIILVKLNFYSAGPQLNPALPRSPQGRQFGRHFPAHCEVQGISDASQSYSAGGSSYAAACCRMATGGWSCRDEQFTVSVIFKYTRLQAENAD